MAQSRDRVFPKLDAGAISRLMIGVVFAISGLALIGGLAGIPALTSIRPQWAVMRLITIACFLMSSVSLICLRDAAVSRRRILATRVLGVAVALVGLITVAAYLVEWATRGQRSLAFVPLLTTFLGPETRMAGITAVLSLGFGCAVLVLSSGRRRAADAGHAVLLLLTAITYLALVGYLFGISELYEWPSPGIALNTAIAFFALCIAGFCARTDTWLLKGFTGDQVGAVMARRLLPALLALPLVIGWLRIQGEQAGLFTSEVGVMLVATTYTVCFVALVWLSARSVNRTDRMRRAAEETVRASEERFRSLFSSMTEGFALHEVILDEKGAPCDYRFLEINPAFEALTGLKRDTVVGRTHNEVLPGNDPRWVKEYGQVALTGTAVHVEDHSAALNRYYEVFAYRPAPLQFAVLFTDITERKQREDELNRLNRTLRALGDSGQAMLRARDEADYLKEVCRIIVEDCGHAMVWIGYAENDEKRTVRPVAHAGFEEGYLETLNITWADAERGRGPTGAAIRTGMPSFCRNMLTDPAFAPWREQALKRGYASSIVLPLKADGRTFGAITIYSRQPDPFSQAETTLLTDLADDLAYGITAIRLREANAQARQALHRERDFVSAVLETEGALVVVLDGQGRITRFNRACEEATGYSAAEVQGRVFWEFLILPEELAGFKAAWDELVAGDFPNSHENYWLAKDGSRRLVAWSNSALTDGGGRVEYVIGAGIDVTEQRKIERALAESEEKFRLVATSTPDHILVQDADLRYVMVLNPQLGLTEKDMIGKTDFDILAKDDAVKITAVKKRVMETGTSEQISASLVSSMGGAEYFEGSYVPRRGHDGRVNGVLGYFRNVTARKRMEDALRESEERYRALVDTAPDAIIVQREGRLLYANAAALRLYGAETFEHLAPHNILDLVAPEDLNKTAKRVRSAMEGEVLPLAEIAVLRLDGRKVEVESVGAPIEFQGARAVQAIIRDITDRKRDEREREMTIEFLQLVNEVRSTGDLVKATAAFFQKQSCCEAVGLRLKEGDDYPYVEARGFPAEFVELENSLCLRDNSGAIVRDADGNPVLECMCGDVIEGRFDPSKPFFSPRGSFWTNSTTQLLAAAAEADLKARTRNRFTGEGYESVALLPLRLGDERLGLLQLNDQRQGMFTSAQIAFWERLADYVSVALARLRAEEGLLRAKEEWERTFDSVPDLIAILDDRNRVVRANKAMAERLGCSTAACVGLRCYESVHGMDAPPAFCPHVMTLKDGREHAAEVHEDGLGGDFLVSTTPLRDEQGRMIGSVHVARDITQRKRIEQALRDTSEYLQNLIDYANAPIIVWDPAFRITRFNHAFERLTGRAAAEVGGRELSILFPDDTREQSMALIRQTATGERWETVEIPIQNVDGGVRIVLWNSATLFGPDGNTPVATIAQGQDITQRKGAEESLRRTAEELARSNKDLEQFAYVASHDLQEPLRMVSGFMQLFAQKYRGQLDAQADQYIHYAVDGAKRMQTLIDDLLTYSRVGSRGGQLVVTDSGRALSHALASLRSAMEESEADVTSGSMPMVRADASQLSQLFQNLIGNAIKFRGDGPPRVRVDARHDGEEWIFSVSDNGIGIAGEFTEQIFLIFQRLHTRDKYPGTGIGLAVCKKIVERHGGRIWVESEIGRGSTFYFSMPD